MPLLLRAACSPCLGASQDPAPGSEPDVALRSKPGQHLLRHALTQEAMAAAVECLGDDAEAAGLAILQLRWVAWLLLPSSNVGQSVMGTSRPNTSLPLLHVSPRNPTSALAASQPAHLRPCRRQPSLRAMFGRVFGVETNSGNNEWMRGKLLQGGWVAGRSSRCLRGMGLCGTVPLVVVAMWW